MFDFSMTIKEVTEEKPEDLLGGHQDVLCSACEMTLMWIHTMLLQNTTREKIFEYVNKVRIHKLLPSYILYLFLIVVNIS